MQAMRRAMEKLDLAAPNLFPKKPKVNGPFLPPTMKFSYDTAHRKFIKRAAKKLL
jgi:hypothetical protein